MVSTAIHLFYLVTGTARLPMLPFAVCPSICSVQSRGIAVLDLRPSQHLCKSVTFVSRVNYWLVAWLALKSYHIRFKKNLVPQNGRQEIKVFSPPNFHEQSCWWLLLFKIIIKKHSEFILNNNRFDIITAVDIFRISLVYCTVQDPAEGVLSGYNDNAGVSVWGRGGKVKVSGISNCHVM